MYKFKPFSNNKTSINTDESHSKVTRAEINKLDNSLKKQNKPRKVRIIPNVLNNQDLALWVMLPKLVHESKTDKMNEVILLMANLGLRVSEAIAFDWSKQAFYNSHLTFDVIGKNGDERNIPNIFKNDYISTKAKLFARDSSEFLKKPFTVTRTGVYEQLKIRSALLHKQGVWNIIDKKFKNQEGKERIWTPAPHDFRRSFATRLICERNIPIFKVSKFLGHVFISTTELYLKGDPRLTTHDI